MRRIKLDADEVQRGVAIAAPSFHLKMADLKAGLPRFSRWGYPVFVDDRVSRKHRYLAGTDRERAESFFSYVKSPLVGTIWCARGGYGAARILPLLDKMGARETLQKNPKLLLGFSDITALHLYFNEHVGLPSVHSFMPTGRLFQRMKPTQEKLLRALFAGDMATGKDSHTTSWPTQRWRAPKSTIEGRLVGGNLSLLTSLVGTPWQPNLKGKILFLEDCDERPYRVDRMLTQLESAGVLKGLEAVLLGDFETDVKYKTPGERKYWKELFLERFDCPVIAGLPVGHGKENEPLPLGVRAAIGSSGKLQLLENVVTKC